MTKEQILADVQDIFRDVFDEEELVIKDETNADDIRTGTASHRCDLRWPSRRSLASSLTLGN